MGKIKRFFLDVWQLPQNIVGVCLLFKYSNKCWLSAVFEDGVEVYRVDELKGYRAFGDFLFVNKHWNYKYVVKASEDNDLSKCLGWFYLPWLGIKALWNKVKK